nr:PREDICTED: suppressor APC domain-containing protein 1 [Paralichthys olivaceus]
MGLWELQNCLQHHRLSLQSSSPSWIPSIVQRLYGAVSWTSVVTDLLSMACHPSSSGSYTVVIIPLRTSLYSLDALRFYLWIKRQKDLEREKDALWSGLEILERARFWYLQRLHENRTRQDNMETRTRLGYCKEDSAETRSSLVRSRILRVNGSLGSVMTEPNVMSSSNPSLPETVADSDLRWYNSVLTQARKIKRVPLVVYDGQEGKVV